jgi:hypothetical protein
MSMTHHNQTKVLTTWFLNPPLDECIDNQKAQNLNFESKTSRSTTRRPKANKSSRRSSRRGGNHKANKRHEKRQNEEKKEKLKLTNSKTPPKSNSP